MLTIRMARTGTKNRPNYRIVICEKGRDNFGNFLENLGTYNPFTKALVVDDAKIKDWISKGAQLSATLNNLLVTKGLLKGEKIKSRRMNTEKLVKARTDKEAAEKKKIEDAKAAEEAAKVAAEAAKAAEVAAAAAAVEVAAEPAVEAPATETVTA